MPYILIASIILIIIYGPSLWTRHILARYDRDEIFQDTGADFARMILSRYRLTHVRVETTSTGDHYDPIEKVIRLNTSTASRKTLTAVVTAAHEAGHAIQDAVDYPPLKLRTGIVGVATIAEKAGIGLIILMPVVTMITRVPAAGFLSLAAGFAVLGLPVIIHLITLPVEFDASFNKAMKIMKEGGYLPADQLPAARRILTACALTYVAAALAGLLNVWRWFRLLRR